MTSARILGLRIDVDTYRGTRDGVPRLLSILNTYDIHASFFFSMGPDNMGRHCWRLLKPAFLLKMLRSNATSLYGWDILLRGTFWPGPQISKRLKAALVQARDAEHEIGLHAWDHHRWQAHLSHMSAAEIKAEIKLGMACCEQIFGQSIDCSAVAGWVCNDLTLLEKAQYPLRYNSDCRGESIFQPLVSGTALTPQIPVTLPTYDEVINHNGISDENYNTHMLSLIKANQLNVLTIHAEVEGGCKAALFEQFLAKANEQDIQIVPLGELLPEAISELPCAEIISAPWPGREGLIAQQNNRP